MNTVPYVTHDPFERIERENLSSFMLTSRACQKWNEKLFLNGRRRSETKIPILQTYTEAGFDPSKDLLQSYLMIGQELTGLSGLQPSKFESEYHKFRIFGELGDAGGLLTDWNLQTSLEGLFAAGDQLFASNYHYHAATTGRYAGRKAAEYASKATYTEISKKQIEEEKNRVYAPVKRNNGMEWKELNRGICRIMQNYCGHLKNKELMEIGLLWLQDLEENVVPEVYAGDPHKLGRTLDVFDILTCSKAIIHACLAREASSQFLGFNRLDFPEMDPPEWKKWIAIKLEDGKVKSKSLSINFWGSLTENYELHNKEYQGWYKS